MERKKIIWNGFGELKKEIETIRFVTSLLLILALIAAMSTGISNFINDTGIDISIWMAPHFFNNYDFIGMYGIIICYMYSYVPCMSKKELYYVVRKNRKVWLTEKLFVIISQGLIVTAFSFLLSIIVFIPNIRFDSSWGKIIYSLAYTEASFTYNIYGKSYKEIIQGYEPAKAMLTSFLFVLFITILVGMLMFAISLLFNRKVCYYFCFLMVGLVYLSEYKIMPHYLNYFALLNWMRIGNFGVYRYGQMTLQKSQCVSLCIIFYLIAFVMILLKIRRMEYNWDNEE